MFQALGPDGIKEGVGQVQLGDLDGIHGHGADEDKGHRLRPRFRNRVSKPTEKTPMRGQNSISKTAKTLRRFTRVLRALNAQIL